MIKCPECGIEYSYGRNVCHICKSNSILFGSLFNQPRRNYNWNCSEEFQTNNNELKKPSCLFIYE
ncbi:MAG: hypothetical protein EAX89_03885 [Candidatus Lokiarchaeota archaeon]|nr:hypothetical protein [Candidatus Lokiarchaeota archaeon]